LDLASFSDLPQSLGFSPSKKLKATREDLIGILGKTPKLPSNLDLKKEASYTYQGIEITPLTWWCGYGPRTQGYLVRPENTTEALPGVLYLHSHDDVKEFGIQKVLDGAGELPSDLEWVRRDHYESQAPVNQLAKAGFAVLVFDCFLWGSRSFSKSDMPARLKEVLQRDNFEDLAVMHESMVLSKYLSLFGSTLAGLLNFDDRIALEVAKNLDEISEKIAVVGLSGGGCRAIYLHATNPEISAAVSVGAMATYESMLNKHVAPHSWMYFPHNLASKFDWPQVAMLNTDTPLLVQYCANDALFTLEGMQTSDSMLKEHYKSTSASYKSNYYQVPHSFTTQMQNDAAEWLKEILLRD
jgi:dienelactone hydrolase